MADSFVVKLSTVTEENVVRQELNHAVFTWKICNFNHRWRRRDDYIKSPQFRCAGVPWCFWIYPHGTREYPGGNVCVDFSSRSTRNYLISAKFTIPRPDGQETIYEVEKYSFKDKLEMMHNGEVQRDYLEHGSFTIKCKMTVFEANTTKVQHWKEEDPSKKKDAKTYKEITSLGFKTSHLCDDSTIEQDDITALINDLEALHKNPRFADVILKLGKHDFPAHKVILRSRSQVFATMFEHNMQETVNLTGMEVDTLKLMLGYIYSGKVRHLSPEEARNLYIAADRYGLPKLVLKCRKIILNELSIDNICETASVPVLYRDQLLMDAVKSFLYKNMKETIKTVKWMMFAKENPLLSLNLIQSVYK